MPKVKKRAGGPAEDDLPRPRSTPDEKAAEDANSDPPLVEQKQIAQFSKSPSLDLYTALVTDALKPSLIDAVRNDIASKRPKIAYPAAVEIFSQNGLLDDIVPLIKQIRIRDHQTRRKIAQTLSASPAHRATGRKLLRQGLARGNKDIMAEIEVAFPSLFMAPESLEVAYKAYGWPYLQWAPTSPEHARILARIAHEFVEIAGGKAFDEDEGYDKSRRYDTRQPKGYPDFSKNIYDWLEVLGEWPDQQEAAAVWDQVRWKTGVDPFGSYGIMSCLADACDDTKFSLAEGIRTAQEVYACKNLQELSKTLVRRTFLRSIGLGREYSRVNVTR